MPDFSFFPETVTQAAPVAKHVTHVSKHVAQHAAAAKPVIQTIHTGFSMLTLFISSLVSSAASAGLAWYIRGRGMAGVKIDLNNAKNEVANLTAKLNATTPAQPV